MTNDNDLTIMQHTLRGFIFAGIYFRGFRGFFNFFAKFSLLIHVYP